MRKFKALFLAIGMVLTVTTFHIWADDIDQLIDKALKLSGITGQLDDLAIAIISTVPGDAFPSSRVKDQIMSFVQKNAGKIALLELLRTTLREQLDRNTLEKIISFYESKLGRKIGRLHETALQPFTIKSIREGRKLLASIEESRKALLRKIIDSDRVIETNRDFFKTVIQGLLTGMPEDDSAPAKAKNLLEATDIANNTLIANNNRTEEIALAAYAYTYRLLDEKELQELASFCESDVAGKFRQAIDDGMNKAIFQAATALGEAIKQMEDTTHKGKSR